MPKTIEIKTGLPAREIVALGKKMISFIVDNGNEMSELPVLISKTDDKDKDFLLISFVVKVSVLKTISLPYDFKKSLKGEEIALKAYYSKARPGGTIILSN